MEMNNIAWVDFINTLSLQSTVSFMNKLNKLTDPLESIDICYENACLREKVVSWVQDKLESKKYNKDIVESERLRIHSNKIFAGRKPPDAVESYSRCLQLTPGGSKEISIIYGNRSAVWFYMKNYNNCLQDIERSLTIFDGKDLRSLKLYNRKVKALIALRQFKSAKDVLNKASEICNQIEVNLKESNSSKEFIKIQTEIALLITQLRNLNNDEHIDNDAQIALPGVTNGNNTKFHSASSLVTLKKNEIQGRFVVANEDIRKGDVLFVEEPVAFVVLSEFTHIYCSHCCKKVSNPIPCDECSGVVYCDERCRDASIGVHECGPHLVLCHDLGISHLALRLAQLGHQHPKHDGYLRASNLVSHIDRLPPLELFQYAVTALAMSCHFGEHLKKKLLIHICQMVYNGHSIADITTAPNDVCSESDSRVAAAIFPSASMMNHSCEPNITNCFYGKYLVVKAVRNIKKGQEVFNCYGPRSKKMDKKQRQSFLKTQYKFNCECIPCTTEETESVKPSPLLEELFEKVEKYSDRFPPLDLLQLVLKTCTEELGDSHKKTISVRDKLAHSFVIQEMYEEAWEYVEANVLCFTSVYGADSSECANEALKLTDVVCALPLSTDHQRCILKKSLFYLKRSLPVFKIYYGEWNERYHEALERIDYLENLVQLGTK